MTEGEKELVTYLINFGPLLRTLNTGALGLSFSQSVLDKQPADADKHRNRACHAIMGGFLCVVEHQPILFLVSIPLFCA